MTVQPRVEIRPIRNGIAARAPALGLAGHGSTETRALDALDRGVRAWCSGLSRDGSLQEALTRRGVEWRSDGTDLVLDFAIQPVTQPEV
jgi:hypothetical protein